MITQEELKTVLYSYQLEEITEGDDDIVLANIEAAIEEVKSYLASRYDVAVIFSQEGNERNPLLVEYLKNIALYHILRLANVDMIYQEAKERYDRAINWLKLVQKGELSPTLPILENETGESVTPFRMGSHQKFNSYY